MKIINATWEKENLGVDTVEFTIEKDDKITVIDTIKRNETEYNVIKLPVRSFVLMNLIQKNGYFFIETQLQFEHNLKKINLAKTYQAYLTELSYEVMSTEDLKELYENIRNDLFNTDRIFNDPNFTSNQASNRYINWLKKTDQGKLYKVSLNNSVTIGFFAINEVSDQVYDVFLAGIYDKYKNFGLGLFVEYFGLLECQKLGAQKFTTKVSSNNIANVNIYLELGCKLKQMNYVFVKHKVN